MRDISIVQRIVTISVIILAIVIGATVLNNLKKEVKYETTQPKEGPAPSPSMTVYPNNGKE